MSVGVCVCVCVRELSGTWGVCFGVKEWLKGGACLCVCAPREKGGRWGLGICLQWPEGAAGEGESV